MDILIAENERVSALKLQRSLEKMGHGVSIARDGVEAWDAIVTGGVSLLISDWKLPEVDGIELCRRVRARGQGPYTYIILLTAREGREARLAGLEAGADDILTKPLDTVELLARVMVASRILAMEIDLRAHADRLAELSLDLERKNAQLSVLAVTDGLTGVSNRRSFDEALEQTLSLAGRLGHPVSLVLLDVDHFKSFNDNFGHSAGDTVLRSVACALRASARAHDVVARYGGEEFALILPATDAQGSCTVAERVRAAIAEIDWPLRPVTVSLGIATSLAQSPTPGPRLVENADRALYGSKADGRNRYTHVDAHAHRAVAPLGVAPA